MSTSDGKILCTAAMMLLLALGGWGCRGPVTAPPPTPDGGIPPGTSPGAFNSIDGGNIAVITTTTLQTLSPTFHGVNYVGFWDPIQGSSASAQALAATGIRLVRFAGGDPGDWYDWQCPYWDGSTCPATPNGSSWSLTSPLQLWRYAQRLGGQALFQTNYQGNVPNPPGQAYAVNSAQNQAAWATYDQQNGIDALFEIGNEEDINMTSYHDPNFQPYINAFNAQAQAIHGVSSTLKAFGPAGTNEWFWWGLDSLGMFLHQTGNKTGTGQVDGISLHYYAGTNWSDSAGLAQQWAAPGGPWEFIQSTRAANDTRPLPVFISEWHLGSSDPSFNPTMANALVTADMIGAFAQSGVAGHQFFSIHGAAFSSNAYGLLYGSGDTRAQDSVTPAYYALVLWGHMGDRVVQDQQGLDRSSQVSSYATTRADGSVQLMLIEKGGADQSLVIGFAGYDPAGRTVTIDEVRPTADRTSLDVTYNGALNPSPAALPPSASQTVAGSQFSYTLRANSLAVLDFH